MRAHASSGWVSRLTLTTTLLPKARQHSPKSAVAQVQKHATRLPPVLTVLAMVLFAVLFGFLGLFLATPLLALVMIATKALYVEDVVENNPRNEG